MNVGQRFGRLVAIKPVAERVQRSLAWEFICDCGAITNRAVALVKKGRQKSCGCLGAETQSGIQKGDFRRKHGMSHTSEYSTWKGMINRCYAEGGKNYKHYAGRGIYVCDNWLSSFERFYEDMGKRPFSNMQLDRIDNNGPYSKENCRWVSRSQNVMNARARSHDGRGFSKTLDVTWRQLMESRKAEGQL